MSLAETLMLMYPDAHPLRDFMVIDAMDGKGPYIAEWSEALGPRPTAEEIAAFVPPVAKSVALATPSTDDQTLQLKTAIQTIADAVGVKVSL